MTETDTSLMRTDDWLLAVQSNEKDSHLPTALGSTPGGTWSKIIIIKLLWEKRSTIWTLARRFYLRDSRHDKECGYNCSDPCR